MHGQRLGAAGEQTADLADRLRIAPVIPDHHDRPQSGALRLGIGSEHRLELFLRDRQRLLDEHVLARAQRLHDVLGVRVVSRRNRDEVDGRVVDHFRCARRADLEAELRRRVPGVDRTRGRDRPHARPQFDERRQQHRLREVARTDEAEDGCSGLARGFRTHRDRRVPAPGSEEAGY